MKKKASGVGLVSLATPKEYADSDSNLDELRKYFSNRHAYSELRLNQIMNSRSWKWTAILRQLYGLVFVRKKLEFSSMIFRTLYFFVSDSVNILKFTRTSIRYFLIAYLTPAGINARNLRIEVRTSEHYSLTEKSLAKSRFVKLTSNSSDVTLNITEEVVFSSFVIFEFALNWTKDKDSSTLYCDVVDTYRDTRFEKPNWDPVYNSSINLFSPFYLESSIASSLKPKKIGEFVSRPLSKLSLGRSTDQTMPLLPKFSLPYRARTNANFSIVVPTANKRVFSGGEVTWLIKEFIEDVNRSQISKLPEIIVVHNKEMSLQDQKLLKKYPNVKLVLCHQKVLNLSAKINMGVKAASCENLLIANDDVLHKSPDWLDALVSWLDMSSIGVVGPQIFYGNGLLQYAGVEIESGNPHIIGYKKSPTSLGLGFSYVVPREVRAVTGVLMATKKSLFMRIGGWDTKLKINYNDIDYCLRISAQGYKIIYEPRSQIFHLESASRDLNIDHKIDYDFFRERHKNIKPLWPALIYDSAETAKLSFSWRQKNLI
jgi:GT2 family glycosyltransferase